ncbi:MAG: heme lyase CcmF/NrfE family subunit [Chloroflexi bacterium]|nr:heme lyase CcmF/NrfE family subunit [Chloroflexota bacterium]
MGTIGYLALFLALAASLYSVIAYFLGGKKKQLVLLASGKNALLAACGLLTLSITILMISIFRHDFQIEYIASYTSRDMSVTYLLTAVWAGASGSLLFWVWLLSVMAAIIVLQRRATGRELVPYAASILMIVQVFFVFLLISVSNPFHRLPFVPADGRGLNPLLENPGMIFHPPTLLAGYVGLTIPFAFAMSALLSRRFGDDWIIAIRRWTLLAWLSLGVGNIVGGWWAYLELGWGGYWAWDPVENASLMPWLVATAFLHSIMMQRRRGMLKIWNMVLIILTFALTIFGTFLTRSGVLSSVHTFGQSNLGPLFLGFIGLSLFAGFGLLYYRSEDLKGEAEMESMLSRESTFLLNNLLLVGATFAVFLGTVFPIISEAVRGTKITVGPPFFNQVNAPILLAIILLAGICTLIGWRRATPRNLVRSFLTPVIFAVIVVLVLLAAGITHAYALIAFGVCAFVLSTILYEWFRGTRARHHTRNENYLIAFFNLLGANRPRYGGYIVHISILLMAVGVVGSSVYAIEREATLKPGDATNVGRYKLEYINTDTYETASRLVVASTLSVYNSDKFIGTLTAEKYFHRSYDQPVTEVAIRSTLREDLYVILLNAEEDGTVVLKLLVNPLVAWVWIGGIVFIIGGLFAFWPDRRRALAAPVRSGEGG